MRTTHPGCRFMCSKKLVRYSPSEFPQTPQICSPGNSLMLPGFFFGGDSADQLAAVFCPIFGRCGIRACSSCKRLHNFFCVSA
jgi:hypothetical protein